ncbi:Wzz/FepE/Etk N-terminal domain-containing protein [Pseudoalteromonas lipolytica]|jgi:LPS O-antigen subunit length determinant protein (WzzB/FepE family)
MQNSNKVLDKHLSVTEELDLRDLIRVIWKGRLIILLVTFLFSILTVAFALNLPNVYKSEALIAPAENEKTGGLANLAGQLGGVASLAGINISGNSTSVNKVDYALAVIKSKKFARNFFNRHQILPELMAVKAWIPESNILQYDENLFNVEKNNWRENGNATLKPTFQTAYSKFSKAITINKMSDTGMYRIAVEHVSPFVAQKWVSWIIEDINDEMRRLDVKEAIKSEVFLKAQIEKTSIMEIRKVLYNLVEEQAKTIMFAEIRDEYIFQTVDPAIVPEKKASPNRLLICILGFLIGLVISVVFVTFKYYFQEHNEEEVAS